MTAEPIRPPRKAPTAILGVDPGGRQSGLVICRGDQLVTHETVVRPTTITDVTPIDLDYCADVIAAARRLIAQGSGEDDRDVELAAVAIEAVVAPNAHMGFTNPAGAIACASVAGAVGTWAMRELGVEVLILDPSGFGGEALRHYPAILQGPRETKGTGILRHCRSAYDVALAARWQLRIDAAAAKQKAGV